jgi:hypothetical protein
MMKKFLVLYASSVSAQQQMSKMTPEQAKSGMDAWMAWSKKAGSAIVDLGAPLGGSTKVTPSAVTPSSSNVGGYSILQADSREGVFDVLKGHPHFSMPGAALEVLEMLPIAGM